MGEERSKRAAAGWDGDRVLLRFADGGDLGVDDAALVDTVTESSYQPDSLDPGQTYYWKINEINEAENISVWEGSVWEFSTVE